MTEGEAKTKWCPFVRYPCGYKAINRPTSAIGDDGNRGSCIGSECMAWRWKVTPQQVTEAWRDEPEHTRITSSDGFCGLAGKL